MASTKLFLLVLCVGVCLVEDVAEENIESLPDWARNTFYQIFGSENDDATQNITYKAEDAATDAIRMPTDKGTDKAHNVYDMKNDVKDGMDNDAYDEAKDELSQAYMSAKNSMTQEDKAKYEAAKEKASEATGNLGAKMRNTPITLKHQIL